MTELGLIDALAQELQEVFKGYSCKGKDDVERPVRVFRQYLPQASGMTKSAARVPDYTEEDYESNFPCIIVKYISHTDNEERGRDMGVTDIELLFGVYDDAQECEGYKDILNMIDMTRLALLQKRVIGMKYMLEMPCKSQLIESDNWPIYWGRMSMIFITGRPIMGRDFFTKEALKIGD